MKHVLVLFLCVLGAGCEQKDPIMSWREFSAIVRPDGSSVDLLQEERAAISESEFLSLIDKLSAGSRTNAVRISVCPVWNWDYSNCDFQNVVDSLVALSNVTDVAIRLERINQQIDLSALLKVNVTELALAGWTMGSPRILGRGLSVGRVALEDVCSVTEIADVDAQSCICRGVAPTMHSILKSFPNIGSVHYVNHKDFPWVERMRRRGVSWMRFCDEEWGEDVLFEELIILLKEKSVCIDLKIPAKKLSVIESFSADDSTDGLDELNAIFREFDFECWRSNYFCEEDARDVSTWSLCVGLENGVERRFSGRGDAPSQILAFWRVVDWLCMRAENKNSCDPIRYYNWRARNFPHWRQ